MMTTASIELNDPHQHGQSEQPTASLPTQPTEQPLNQPTRQSMIQTNCDIQVTFVDDKDVLMISNF